MFGIKLGLTPIRRLLERLHHPDRAYQTALVAGTNGKGSVVAMAESAIRAAGWRTGRYTSPHLTSVEERFAIDGEPVTPPVLDAALERVREAAAGLEAPPTYFEATTAAALDIFRTARVDVAVLEVGLGGRLDATNAVEPVATAISAIDLDHTAHLGHRLEDIAREKAGIVRPHVPLVLGPNPPAVRQIVRDTCLAAGARFVDAVDGCETTATTRDGQTTVDVQTPHRAYRNLTLALRGRHQVSNALTTIRLLEEWRMPDRSTVDDAAVRRGLATAVWPGRLELRRSGDLAVLLDGAHNPGGARSLAAFVQETYGRRLPFVVGIMSDKAHDDMLTAMAPAAALFVFTAPDHPRAARPSDLAATARTQCPDVPTIVEADPVEAIRRAGQAGTPVVVAGSLYLVGQVRPYLS